MVVREESFKNDTNACSSNDLDDREFQLVTWSKDQNLRLWPITDDIMKSVGHQRSHKKSPCPVPATAMRPDGTYRTRSFQEEPDDNEPESGMTTPLRLGPGDAASAMTPFRSAAPLTTSSGYDTLASGVREHKYFISPLLWMQNVKTVGPPSELRRAATTENTYQTVAEEMSTVLNKYTSAGVKTEKIIPASRTCTISLHGPWSDTGVAFVRITIRFSAQYPDNSSPEFDIQKNSMMSIYYRARMLQDLNALAATLTAQKRWCLEACLRYLLGETRQEDQGEAVDTSPFGSLNGNNWGTATAAAAVVDNGESDDEIFAGPPFLGTNGKRSSMQGDRGIVVDMSSKQTADEKVPFPRLCGGVFSGNGQLVCFFSTLRMRDSQRPNNKTVSSPPDENNAEYFENTYSDFYKHPRTYVQFEEYKEIAAMSRQGRNATVLVGGSGGAFGEYAYDDDPDDFDDGVTNMTSLYFKPEVSQNKNKKSKNIWGIAAAVCLFGGGAERGRERVERVRANLTTQ